MKSAGAAMMLAAMVTLGGCTITQQAPKDTIVKSGFLTDYAQLQPTKGGDYAAYLYLDKTAPWASYTKVYVKPVEFWASPDSKVPNDVASQLTNYAYQQLVDQLQAKGFTMATGPGPGTMVMRAALTDATSATPGLRTVSVVVPQAIILGAAVGAVRGEPSFSGSAQTEGEILDGTSGKRIAAWVDRRVGGNSIENANVWKWGDAENAIKAWAVRGATRLWDLHEGQDPFPAS
jgi:Protein of unknown function (DUF3313)